MSKKNKNSKSNKSQNSNNNSQANRTNNTNLAHECTRENCTCSKNNNCDALRQGE